VKCALTETGTTALKSIVYCVNDPEPAWKVALSIVPAILLVLTVISLLLAARSIRNTRAIARQKATLDLIEKVESTAHYRDVVKAFATLDTDALEALNAPASDEQKIARQHVLDYLNHYELVAIGIANDILDDGIYRRWMASYAVGDWNKAAQFVQAERWRLNEAGTDFEYRPDIFGNLQKAVGRWSSKAVVLTGDPATKPALPKLKTAPGDLPLPQTNPLPD
jgi:hypothetical protein